MQKKLPEADYSTHLISRPTTYVNTDTNDGIFSVIPANTFFGLQFPVAKRGNASTFDVVQLPLAHSLYKRDGQVSVATAFRIKRPGIYEARVRWGPLFTNMDTLVAQIMQQKLDDCGNLVENPIAFSSISLMRSNEPDNGSYKNYGVYLMLAPYFISQPNFLYYCRIINKSMETVPSQKMMLTGVDGSASASFVILRFGDDPDQ